jgi:CRISPR-associated protein (TIGR03986 family)
MSDKQLEQARVEGRKRFEQELACRGATRELAAETVGNWFYDEICGFHPDPKTEADGFQRELTNLTAIQGTGAPAVAKAAAKGGRATGSARAVQAQQDPRRAVDEALLTSPFRFVPLNDVVVPPEEAARRCRLDRPLPGGFSGRIRVTWAAETPLLIGEERFETVRLRTGGNGSAEVSGPMRLGPDGPYVIPGATLRGCLRTAVEIVASGRLSQINAHHRYGLRDFDHPRVRWIDEQGEEQSLLDRVRAGWLLRKTDGTGYEIVPCADWKTIAIADLPGRGRRNEYQWRSDWLILEIDKRYATVGYKVSRGRIPVIEFNNDVVREFVRNPKEAGPGELILKPGGDIRGTLVFSNKSPSTPGPEKIRLMEQQRQQGQPKKREYVFIDELHAETFAVPEKAWRRFELINSKPGKNEAVPDGSWAALKPSLDADGGRIPVFFIGDHENENQFQFGLTRFFKVAHEFSVGEMRDRDAAHKRQPVDDAALLDTDFVENLFGYVFEKDEVFRDPEAAGGATAPRDVARKGRIAFGFATLMTPATQVQETELYETVMSAPRASYAPFYLRGRFKDYSASESDTRLAGRKRYLVRFDRNGLRRADAQIGERLRNQITRLEKVNDNILSRLRLLKPKAAGTDMVFTGDIRLHNVTAAEIGAVLWALTHGGDPDKCYRHLIGRAKPFGAGQVRVRQLDLMLNGHNDAAKALLVDAEPWERADAGSGREGWLAVGSRSLAPFLRRFHDHMVRYRAAWPQVPDMVEFLAAADPAVGSAADRMRYPWLRTPRDMNVDRAKQNEFNYNRQLTKRANKLAAPASDCPRFLPVLTEDAIRERMTRIQLPYVEGGR